MRKQIKSQEKAIKEIIQDSHFRFTEDGRAFTNRNRNGTVSATNVWRELALINEHGYKHVNYHNKTIRLHRIIYAMFKGKLVEGLTINHINGDKTNNHVDNIEQVTQKENNLHAYRVLKHSPRYGFAKINKKIADEIREYRFKDKLSYIDIGCKFPEYKINATMISRIVNNKIWV